MLIIEKIWEVKNVVKLYLNFQNYWQGQETRWNHRRKTDLGVLTWASSCVAWGGSHQLGWEGHHPAIPSLVTSELRHGAALSKCSGARHSSRRRTISLRMTSTLPSDDIYAALRAGAAGSLSVGRVLSCCLLYSCPRLHCFIDGFCYLTLYHTIKKNDI